MRSWLIAVLVCACVPALAADSLDGIAGVYKARHVIEVFGDARGRVPAENVLEIVKTAPDVAYVRAELVFDNGHTCTIASILKAEGDALVWRHRVPGAGLCELRLDFSGGDVVFHDKGGICRMENCGARGSFEGISFERQSRRPIGYMRRLLASREYREAMAARKVK